jgi:hypothetical protein
MEIHQDTGMSSKTISCVHLLRVGPVRHCKLDLFYRYRFRYRCYCSNFHRVV